MDARRKNLMDFFDHNISYVSEKKIVQEVKPLISNENNNIETAMENSNNALPRWDLRDFYDDYKSQKLIDDNNTLSEMVSKFNSQYEGRLNSLSADELYKAIVEYEEISSLSGKIGSYSYLLYSTNLNNQDILSFFQHISEKLNDLGTNLLFFKMELNQIEDDKIKELLKHENLSRYASWINRSRSFKPYQLSEKEEKILHEKNITSSEYWVKLFDMTTSNMRFNYRGQELTYSEISDKTLDLDESVRKDASLAISAELKKNIDLFTVITNALAKDKAIDDRIRGAKSVTTFQNLSNEIEDEVVEALVTASKKNYANIAQRYYKIKAKWMGKEKLEFWDRNAPLGQEDDKTVPWTDAKSIVLNAYNNFSPEFANIAKKFFDKNWIDAEPYPGKNYGAYSSATVASVHPYILMNYHGKNYDIRVLAHELGHGVHQSLASGVGDLMSHTPLTLAETASIFGEQLVFDYMMNEEKDKAKRKVMLANKIEDSLNTIFRQISFYEFEHRVHNTRKERELTSDELSNIWIDVNKDLFGDTLNFREEARFGWSYIPHFIHSPFYVYSYAFGNCLVNSIYMVYKKGEVKDFVPKYIDLLKSGGTKNHKELLDPFGLDATDPNFWQKGLDVVSEMIDELSAME